MEQKNIPETIRNSVWNIYTSIEQKQKMCFCCGTEPITFGNFVCGYIKPKSKNGKATIQNLRPICGLCNMSIGTKNMEKFMNKYGLIKNKNWNGTYNQYMIQEKREIDEMINKLALLESKNKELEENIKKLNYECNK